MISSAKDIITEVNRRADELNYQVQLYALELYQKEYFKHQHFSGEDYYSNLYRQRHRINKTIETWGDFYNLDDINYLHLRKEKITSIIEEMKSERKRYRESFILNFVSR